MNDHDDLSGVCEGYQGAAFQIRRSPIVSAYLSSNGLLSCAGIEDQGQPDSAMVQSFPRSGLTCFSTT